MNLLSQLIEATAKAEAMAEAFLLAREETAETIADELLEKHGRKADEFEGKHKIMEYLIREKEYRFSNVVQHNPNERHLHEALFIVTDKAYEEIYISRAVILNSDEETIAIAEIELGEEGLADLRERALAKQKLH